MSSEVSICNIALALIGEEGIESLDEPTASGRACRAFYDVARDAELRAHPWNFTTKYLTLASLGTPEGLWSYRYAYPADCLRLRCIVPPTREAEPVPFEVATNPALNARVINTDQGQAVACYTASVSDANLFDPLAVVAIAHGLAAHIAPLIAKNQNRVDRVLRFAPVAVARARAGDAAEGQADETVAEAATPWIRDR